MGYIYKITNKLNLKIYIGKCQCSIEARFKQHCSRAEHWYDKKQDFNSHLYPAMVKDGIENFKIEQIEECQNSKLGAREKYYIKLLDAQNPEVGYNIAAGGESFWEGHKHSAETKKKIGEHSAKINLGKHLSEETKEKIRQAHLGKCFRKDFHHSEETKQQLSEMKKGKPGPRLGSHLSAEQIEKLRLSHLGKKASEETKQKQSIGIKNAVNTKLTPEERSERTRKGWLTRRQKKEE